MERADRTRIGHEPVAGVLDPGRVLDAVDQAIIITDLDGTISFWNRAAEELYGWARDEALGRPILEVTPTEEVVGAAAGVMEALRGGRSWTGDMVLRRRDGGSFMARVTDTPILDEAGEVVGIIGVSQELVEAANRYQAALLGALYDASIDGVLVVGPDGQVLSHNARFLEMWGFDAALVERGDAALLAAARAAVADPDRFTAGVDDAYLHRPERVYHEVVLADGRTFDRHGAALRAHDGEHLGFAWSFRDVSVERAQRAELAASSIRSSILARTLQQSLLPHRLPAIPGIDVAARYHPALDGVVVGGDFYDVFPFGDDWLLVLGDVCGKGAEAAALTALIRYSVRAVALSAGDPEAVLRELNTVMLHDSESGQPEGAGRLATACCIRLRHQACGVAADVACAGHPLPLVLRREATVEEVGAYGTILGALHDVEISATTTLLRPGDCIIAYTDGVTEARDLHGQQFEDLLVGAVAGLAGRSAAEISATVEARALDWQGGVASDDIAILAARIAEDFVG